MYGDDEWEPDDPPDPIAPDIVVDWEPPNTIATLLAADGTPICHVVDRRPAGYL